MDRFRRMTLPPWVQYWLTGLGVAWLVTGWVGGWFWLVGVVFAAIFASLMRRKFVHVRLQPWRKETGMVLWGYRRNEEPLITPTLVWHERPPAVDEQPLLEDWPLRPLPPDASTEAADPAPVPRDTGRKICPDCAETVLSEARVCRYCGYRFEPLAAEP